MPDRFLALLSSVVSIIQLHEKIDSALLIWKRVLGLEFILPVESGIFQIIKNVLDTFECPNLVPAVSDRGGPCPTHARR